jgi:hypothetical protein
MPIARYLEKEGKVVFDDEIEVNEHYFGDIRKGKRSRSSALPSCLNCCAVVMMSSFFSMALMH